MDWESVLTGAALVILGFVLAIGWDVLKTRRVTRRRDVSLLTAARAEVKAIQSTVQNNQNLIERELQVLTEQQHLLNPLDPVEGGFWDVVKLDPPRWLLLEPETLAQVRTVARLTAQVNEMIRSRETFRVGSKALSNFSEHLEKYDQLLIQFQSELLTALSQLHAALERA